MKTAAIHRTPFMSRPIVPLPNATSRRQFFHNLLDKVVIVVSGVGIAVMLLFFLTLV